MKFAPLILVVSLITFTLFSASTVSAQVEESIEAPLMEAPARRKAGSRFDTTFDYVAPVRFTGSTDVGKIGIYTFSTSLQHTFQILPDTGLIVGGNFRQLWFSSSGGDDVIPENAGSIAAAVGIRQDFWENWNFLILGNFGIYSSEWNSVGSKSWNFDAMATVGYSFSENLQAFVGVAVFPQFQIPVLPAVGVRWRINDQWNLNLAMPKPTLEYEFVEGWKVYAFGQLTGGRFRTSPDFGSPERPNLGNRWLSYLDLRVGGGISWSPIPIVILRAEAGSSVYREFEFEGADFSVNAGPAFLASTSLSIRF